jgi:hypothetical protein
MICSNILIYEFDVFDMFQERCGNGTGPLDNMRNLEHYLNDIMRSGTENPEHAKGKVTAHNLLYEKCTILMLHINIILKQC